jgi:hypothetical protein
MLTVQESAIIPRPQQEVFDTAADPTTQLEWDRDTLKRVQKLSPGPLGQGTKYRGKFKGFGMVDYEFEEYEPPRRFTHLAKMPMGEMRHIFTFDPVPEGTRMTQEAQLRPNLLGRIAAPIMLRFLRKRFRTIADEVGTYLEGRQGTRS